MRSFAYAWSLSMTNPFWLTDTSVTRQRHIMLSFLETDTSSPHHAFPFMSFATSSLTYRYSSR